MKLLTYWTTLWNGDFTATCFTIQDYKFESKIVIVEKHQKNSQKQNIQLIKEKFTLFVVNAMKEWFPKDLQRRP